MKKSILGLTTLAISLGMISQAMADLQVVGSINVQKNRDYSVANRLPVGAVLHSLRLTDNESSHPCVAPDDYGILNPTSIYIRNGCRGDFDIIAEVPVINTPYGRLEKKVISISQYMNSSGYNSQIDLLQSSAASEVLYNYAYSGSMLDSVEVRVSNASWVTTKTMALEFNGQIVDIKSVSSENGVLLLSLDKMNNPAIIMQTIRSLRLISRTDFTLVSSVTLNILRGGGYQPQPQPWPQPQPQPWPNPQPQPQPWPQPQPGPINPGPGEVSIPLWKRDFRTGETIALSGGGMIEKVKITARGPGVGGASLELTTHGRYNGTTSFGSDYKTQEIYPNDGRSPLQGSYLKVTGDIEILSISVQVK